MASSSAPAAEPKPVAHMHPKIASLLHHHHLSLWIPILEAEIPKAVTDFERFVAIGEYSMRAVFEEINELHDENEQAEKLPPEKLNRLLATLYPKDKAPSAAAPATVVAPASAAPTEAPCDGPLSERWTFDQSTAEVYLKLRGLPISTKAKDVKLHSLAKTLSLSVSGEVVLHEAPLHLMVVSDETDFDLQDAPGRQSRTLTVTLLKANSLPSAELWPSLLGTA